MYHIWKTVNRTMTKILMKVLATITLVSLVIFAAVFKVFMFLFRLAALPLTVIGIITAVFYYNEAGLCFEFYCLVAGVIAAVAAYFTFPMIPPALDAMKDYLKDYVAEPLFIRSPVKFTM